MKQENTMEIGSLFITCGIEAAQCVWSAVDHIVKNVVEEEAAEVFHAPGSVASILPYLV